MDWEDKSCVATPHPAADTAATLSSCTRSSAQHSRVCTAGKNPPLLYPITRPPHSPQAACREPLPVAQRAVNWLWRESKVSLRQVDGCAAAGTAHSMWWELGARRGAASGAQSEQGVVENEPPVPAEEGWRDVEAELCLPAHTTEHFQLF